MTLLTHRSSAGIFAVIAVAASLSLTPLASTAAASSGAGALAEVGASFAQTTPPLPLPADPTGLTAPGPMGAEVDDLASYQPQLACVHKALPGTRRLRALALATYARGGTSPATPRACSSGSASEHKEGRAWDWMLSAGSKADRHVAADFLSWLTGEGPSGEQGEMAARLGVMYVIFNRKIWSAYAPGWRDYTGSDPHTSHIHISLSWNGARAHTSFWTGRVWARDYGVCQVFQDQPAVVPNKSPRIEPCPDPAAVPRSSAQPLAWLGSAGESVTKGQRLVDATTTGTFGTETRRAVLGYQKHHDLPRTGALDDPTWASLLPSERSDHVPSWSATEAATWARSAGSPPLRRGDAGRAVYALQVALRMEDASRNGYYGTSTRSLVVGVKRDLGLPATALVTDEVWAALPIG